MKRSDWLGLFGLAAIWGMGIGSLFGAPEEAPATATLITACAYGSVNAGDDRDQRSAGQRFPCSETLTARWQPQTYR